MTRPTPAGAAPALRALLPHTTDGPDATLAFGRRLAAHLKPGDVVALYGDLGAGKTHLVKGLCSAWGIDPIDVSSPTFSIVNEYAGSRFPVYHFDAYRVERPEELYEIGFEEYFYGEGVSIVEWPSKVEALLPDDTVRLTLAHAGPTARRILLYEPLEHEPQADRER